MSPSSTTTATIPTEVAATLTAARPVAGDGRLLVVFQPHRYSRTGGLRRQEFGAALGLADVIVVMDVYSAGEDPLPGISGRTVADAVPPPGDRVVYEPNWARVPPLLATLARPGDLLLTMGAGDVTQLGPEVLRELAERERRLRELLTWDRVTAKCSAPSRCPPSAGST